MNSFAHKRSEHYLKHVDSHEVMSSAVKDRMHRYVNIAKALFNKGACSHGRTQNFTFVAKKGKVIAIGMNDYRRDMNRYVKLLKTNYKKVGEANYVPSLHAELSAVLKLGLDDCSDFDFYNVRIDKNCHCKPSCCCANCFRTLRIVGFKNLYFYDDSMRICKLG